MKRELKQQPPTGAANCKTTRLERGGGMKRKQKQQPPTGAASCKHYLPRKLKVGWRESRSSSHQQGRAAANTTCLGKGGGMKRE